MATPSCKWFKLKHLVYLYIGIFRKKIEAGSVWLVVTPLLCGVGLHCAPVTRQTMASFIFLILPATELPTLHYRNTRHWTLGYIYTGSCGP